MLQSLPAEIGPPGIVPVIDQYTLLLHILHQSHELNIQQGKDPVLQPQPDKFRMAINCIKVIDANNFHTFLHCHLEDLL